MQLGSPWDSTSTGRPFASDERTLVQLAPVSSDDEESAGFSSKWGLGPLRFPTPTFRLWADGDYDGSTD